MYINTKRIISIAFSLYISTFSFLTACNSENKNDNNESKNTSSINNLKNNISISTKFDKAERIVAIGDLHGDFDATKNALKKAGAIDSSNHWIGGKLVVVQTGDQLDRGNDEKEIVDLFESISIEAKKTGGFVHVLNGNHEVMNVAEDFRYVTEEGFTDFEHIPNLDLSNPMVKKHPEHERARTAALIPGGIYAKIFAKRNTIVIVGDILFVHGGILPKYSDYGIEKINQEVRDWMNGELKTIPTPITAEDGPIWNRDYSDSDNKRPNQNDCSMLDQVLSKTKTKYMVVGHTIQKEGINSACNGKVWRIDIGMSKAYYGKPPQILEFKNNKFNVIR